MARNMILCVALLGLLAGAFGAGEGLPQGVQVVAWIKHADLDQEWANVKQILVEVGVQAIETKDPTELGSLLGQSGARVLLIPEQEEAWEETLVEVGASLSPALVGFLERGGQIVALEHAAGSSDILRGAGLTAANDETALAGESLEVRAPEDPLMQSPYQIPAQFEAPNGTTDFTGVDPDAKVLVVAPKIGKPVAFKLARHGGEIVFLGFDYYEHNEATRHLLINALFTAAPRSSSLPLSQSPARAHVRFSAELPPKVLEAAQSAVGIEASGKCTQSEGWGLYRASGMILKQDGSVLAPGHAFWCGDNPADQFKPSTIEIWIARWKWELGEEGRWSGEFLERVRLRPDDLARCTPNNPALDTGRDLALIKLVDRQLPRGLKVGEARQDQTVWLLGYGDPDQLTSIQGVVTGVDVDDKGEAMRIRIRVDTPPQPGMSGSPVVTEDGIVIGIVVRAGADRVIAAPTPAARALYERVVCP